MAYKEAKDLNLGESRAYDHFNFEVVQERIEDELWAIHLREISQDITTNVFKKSYSEYQADQDYYATINVVKMIFYIMPKPARKVIFTNIQD